MMLFNEKSRKINFNSQLFFMQYNEAIKLSCYTVYHEDYY